MKITSEQYYRPSDPELRQIAAVQTLASWRHQGRGPSYVLSGSRVLYKGADLVAWLNANRVDTNAEGQMLEIEKHPHGRATKTNHHETGEDYCGVVAQLSDCWRVVDCKDGIQWILQRRDAQRSGRARWKAVRYVRTRNALIRVSRTLCGRIEPTAQAVLANLPEQIGKST